MRTVQQGDRVQVHFVKRFQYGKVVSSRGRPFLELEVGKENRHLPGLGLALVGLSAGQRVTVSVPAQLAYGPVGPARLCRLARSRFAPGRALTVGRWAPVSLRNGRRRLVRVVEVRDTCVVVDTNHRWAGQDVTLEVEVLAISAPDGAA